MPTGPASQPSWLRQVGESSGNNFPGLLGAIRYMGCSDLITNDRAIRVSCVCHLHFTLCQGKVLLVHTIVYFINFCKWLKSGSHLITVQDHKML